jgi:hypothetical protein
VGSGDCRSFSSITYGRRRAGLEKARRACRLEGKVAAQGAVRSFAISEPAMCLRFGSFHGGAHHEESPSRLCQRQKWQSNSYWRDADPFWQGQMSSSYSPGEKIFGQARRNDLQEGNDSLIPRQKLLIDVRFTPRKRTFAPDVGDVCFCAKSGLMHRSISICVLVTNPHTTCRAARVLKRSADNLGNPYRCP